jgi:hypothetical protein
VASVQNRTLSARASGQVQAGPKVFLAAVTGGRIHLQIAKGPRLFAQSDGANALFRNHGRKVKITVVSEEGKESVVAMPGTDEFFGEGCRDGQAWRPGPLPIVGAVTNRRITVVCCGQFCSDATCIPILGCCARQE